MKQIVCLATSPWYPIPTRKQQVMSRMPDAEILYFDPSATIIAPLRDKSTKPLMTAWKEPGEKVRDNITVAGAAVFLQVPRHQPHQPEAHCAFRVREDERARLFQAASVGLLSGDGRLCGPDSARSSGL